MKVIKVLRSLGAGLPRFVEGQVVEVDDGTVNQLVSAGLADLIRTVPPRGDVLIAVPPDSTDPPADPAPDQESDKPMSSSRQPGHAKRHKRTN